MTSSTPHSSSQPQSEPHPKPKTLILVCCHAIFIGPQSISPLPSSSTSTPSTQLPSAQDIPLDPYDPTQWLLQPFQATEAPTFVAHIQTGLDLLRADPSSILVFSGGRTKRSQGCEVSEAESYMRVARWLIGNVKSSRVEAGVNGGKDEDMEHLTGRIYLEEYATDSFQNVLFGVLGWSIWSTRPQLDGSLLSSTQSWFLNLPEKLVIVSHAFKRARFMELHLPAIRELLGEKRRLEFDGMEVEYVGIDPPFSEEERRDVEDGERIRGYEPWVKDKSGVGKVLDAKRRARGWDGGIEYLEWWREKMSVEGRDKEDVNAIVRKVERIISGRTGEGG